MDEMDGWISVTYGGWMGMDGDGMAGNSAKDARLEIKGFFDVGAVVVYSPVD